MDSLASRRRIVVLALVVLLVVLSGAFLLTQNQTKNAPSNTKSICQELVHYTWLAKLKEKKVDYLGKSSNSVKICGDVPVSGIENAKVVLSDATGKTLFEQKIFVQLEVIAESFQGDKIEGVATAGEETVFNANVPVTIKPGTKIKLINLTNNTLLAEGTI